MQDPRIDKLAEILVTYSCRVQRGENVLIEAYDIPDEAVATVVKHVALAGGKPFVTVKSNTVLRALYNAATDEQMSLIGDLEAERMSKMQAYIGLRGAFNSAEFSDVPDEKMKLFREHWWHKVHSGVRVPKTKWVVLRWPTASMAQEAGKSTEAFEQFYFDVCTFDYSKMAAACEPLKKLMEQTDKVRLVGPGTDLSFSIKNIPVIPCTGEFNIPDGECFTAPVKDSVEGQIAFNAATTYSGKIFEGVTLSFAQGQIIAATALGRPDRRPQRHPRLRSRLALHRRVLPRLQPLHLEPDEGHPLRRKNRRLPPLHPRPSLRNRRQRQPLHGALGHGAHAAPRARRRRNLLRRQADPERWRVSGAGA